MSDTAVHFVIKAHIPDVSATLFQFSAAKTMYGGKQIRAGDKAFLFASENEGGPGLIGSAVIVSSTADPKLMEVSRQTPRVTVTARPAAVARRPLGRAQLKRFTDWDDGRPETELNFKLYRQATNKIVGISQEAASFLESFF